MKIPPKHRLKKKKRKLLLGYCAHPAIYYRRRKDVDKKDWYFFNSRINPSFWNSTTLKNQTWFARKSSYYRAKTVVKRNVELLTYSQNYWARVRFLLQSRRYMKRFAIYLIKLMRQKPEIHIRYKYWIRRFLATPWTVRLVRWAKRYRTIEFYTYGWFLYLIQILYALWCDTVPTSFLLSLIAPLCLITYMIYSFLEKLIFSNLDAILYLFI